MKANQRLVVKFENITTIQLFKDLDKKLLPLVARLEKEGNEYGPIVEVVDGICCQLQYADKAIGPVKSTIFGYDQDEFLAKQY